MREPAEKSLARFGKVDVPVNNAGIALYSEVAHKTVSDWDISLKTNLIAPFLLSQILVRKW